MTGVTFVTCTVTPANVTATQCLDITIESNPGPPPTPLESATCMSSGHTIEAELNPGTYTIEVDLDDSSAEPSAAHPRSGTLQWE